MLIVLFFGGALATYPHVGPPSTGGCPCGLGHAFEPIGELIIDPSPSSDRYPPGELNLIGQNAIYRITHLPDLWWVLGANVIEV